MTSKHIGWILLIGGLFIITLILVLAYVYRERPVVKADVSVPSTFKVGPATILGKEKETGSRIYTTYNESDVLTLQDWYSRQVFMVYLCARIPHLADGTIVKLIYVAQPKDDGGCHELKVMQTCYKQEDGSAECPKMESSQHQP